MRICLDISPAIHRHAGLGRYAHELVAALTAFDRENEYCAFYNAPRGTRKPDAPIDRLPAYTVPLGAKPWRMSVLVATFGGMAMDRWLPRADIFHATDHLLPPLYAKSVFTLHDLIFRIFPEYHLPLNRWFLTLMLPHFLRRADAVIAVSECTKRDAICFYSLPPEKITVVYEGVNSALRPTHDPNVIEHARTRYAKGQPFLFFLGTIEPRKNIVALIDALRVLRARGFPHRLLIAGRKGWLYQSTFDHVKKTGMESAIDFLDYVDDAELPALFAACDAFVFPSLYEGFGLPPLEAMACGAPVVSSNTSSLPEILGDAAIFVNPRDVGEIAAAIERVITGHTLRDELRAKGISQAAKFSWERAARETLQVYNRIAKRR